MKKVLVVAPHADDETLGCGGTLLRLKQEGAQIYWLLLTTPTVESGFSKSIVDERRDEIRQVISQYQFDGVYELGFSPSMLDTYSQAELISSMSKVVKDIKPDWVFCPYRNDAHSDHQVTFDATLAVTKSFRYPFIKKVMCYETLSETNFALKPEDPGFKPQIFIDISDFLTKKLDILTIYSTELGEFPFPRSLKAVEALAILRGSQANQEASEAFMLLKEIL